MGITSKIKSAAASYAKNVAGGAKIVAGAVSSATKKAGSSQSANALQATLLPGVGINNKGLVTITKGGLQTTGGADTKAIANTKFVSGGGTVPVNVNKATASGGLATGNVSTNKISSGISGRVSSFVSPTALSVGQFGAQGFSGTPTTPAGTFVASKTNNAPASGIISTGTVRTPITPITLPEEKYNDPTSLIPPIVPITEEKPKEVNPTDVALQSYIDSLNGAPTSEKAYKKAQEESGILNARTEVNNLSAKLNEIVNRGQAQQLSLVGQGRGIPEAIIGGQQAQIGRETAIAALPVQAQLSAAQGNLEMAQDNLDTLFKIYADDARVKYENKKEKAKILWQDATEKEKRLIEKADKLEERAYQEKESIRKEVRDYAKLAMTNGQSDLSARISSLARDVGSPTFDADMQALVRKIKDPVQTAQLQKLNLEISQLNNAVTGGEGNANLTAYASQYADSGKLPSPAELKLSGLSVGQVTAMAKQIPRGKGFVVSNVTGTKSNSISAEAEKDFQKLYNITEMTKRLKELDEKRIGGVVAGTLGKVFGSEAQGEYLTLRKAIVDEMSRMQSGAALTPDEIAVYNDYLPGRFSETLGLGQDSLKKIQNFETAMNQKLENRLSNNGLSIYGYSKVPVGNTLRTVGEIIDIGGVNYRVLPDGSLTDIL